MSAEVCVIGVLLDFPLCAERKIAGDFAVPLACRPMKASHAIAADLRQLIARGELKAGDSLPVERELVDRLGASRGVVREALRILEREGLVEVRRGLGGGPRVRHPSISEAAQGMGVYLQLGDVPVLDAWTARDRIIGCAVERLALGSIPSGRRRARTLRRRARRARGGLRRLRPAAARRGRDGRAPRWQRHRARPCRRPPSHHGCRAGRRHQDRGRGPRGRRRRRRKVHRGGLAERRGPSPAVATRRRHDRPTTARPTSSGTGSPIGTLALGWSTWSQQLRS